MARARIYDAAGETRDFFYVTGEPELVSDSGSKLVLEATIQSGRFRGETSVIEWIGEFDLARGEGVISEWRERVDGELHFSIRFDEPVDLDDLFTDFEALEDLTVLGNRFANLWRGDDTAERLFGNGGDDRLLGLAGRDRIDGGTGEDRLFGGDDGDVIRGDAGRDALFGGDGRDRLFAGTGPDTLTGGDGADVFVFQSAREAGNGLRSDLIRDFGRGRDKIDLTSIAEGVSADFDFIGDARFSSAAGELRFAGGRLSGDLDGDGDGDFRIGFAERTEVAEADLLL